MKTHKIDPNKIRPGIANFTIEFRYAEKPKEAMIGSNNAINQRWLRLVEMPPTDEKPRKTVWHEIYAEQLVTNAKFAKWVKHCCQQFTWMGKHKDMMRLLFIMSELASIEVVAKRGLVTTNEASSSLEEE